MGYWVDIADDEKIPSAWALLASYMLVAVLGTAAVVGLVALAFLAGPWLMYAMLGGCLVAGVVGSGIVLRRD